MYEVRGTHFFSWQAIGPWQSIGVLYGEVNSSRAHMIAVEKADLSFQLMMQVRNKIVDAYQQISQMPF